jgi:hypothetical protein
MAQSPKLEPVVLQGQLGFAQHPHGTAFSSSIWALARPGAKPAPSCLGVAPSTSGKKEAAREGGFNLEGGSFV